ncbi:hypothetical protein [Methylophaga sp. OBS4]|uniref:hypothetical protein n=1 Tax=Methylophaga sp. OBS4 TaxID=2991935 RepID=UPI00224F613D|nr:hypothetical protein [Methylophaga sp. OBS4]MCX4187385.1 hypothetical protein [Methylophaga sp. OBS4]
MITGKSAAKMSSGRQIAITAATKIYSQMATTLSPSNKVMINIGWQDGGSSLIDSDTDFFIRY